MKIFRLSVVKKANSNLGLRQIDFANGNSETTLVNFEHTREIYIPVTEEFIEHCAEGALSIEVYGHRSAGLASEAQWEERQQLAKSLADR